MPEETDEIEKAAAPDEQREGWMRVAKLIDDRFEAIEERLAALEGRLGGPTH